MPETAPTPMTRGTPPPQGRPVPPSRPATGTDTVTVACKVSNGLILRVFEMRDTSEAVFGGGSITVKKSFQVGGDVVLRGSALDPAELRAGRMPTFPFGGGYSLTPGVPREFWERWLEQNRDSPIVQNNLVFAHSDVNSTLDAAREREAVESGYEGIDPENPSKRTGIRAVERGGTPGR